MLENLAALSLSFHIGLTAILGLIIGSFLNVVIYRQPLRLKHQWTAQSYDWLDIKPKVALSSPPGIITPASRCQHCQTPIKAWQNIPVISYLFLAGKCANCKASISWRYPAIELLTAILSAVVMWHFGWGWQCAMGLIVTWALVALTFIDVDHQLLPDEIVLPVLWLGLLLNAFGLFASLQSAVIGAIAGYLSLWLVYHAFKLITGKEGMGYGDFKLLALFGAWLGWEYLPQIILVSTLLGSLIGILLIVLKKASRDKAIPFGPYLALAGWLALIWGEQINNTYLQAFKF